MKAFELFRAGKHVSASGVAVEITADQLRDAAAAYSAELHEAPIVVGHPKDNHPAFGWIKSLKVEGDTLIAEPAEVEPEFADLVAKGRYKKRSASFYLPDAPNNPAPGKLYLRHAGFLGAMPPAVKGLKDVAFADGEAGVVEFADSARWAWGSMAAIARMFREWVIGKDGVEAADKVVPNYLISDLENAAKEARDEPQTAGVPAFSEEDDMKTAAELQAEIDRLTAENTRLKANQMPADFAERDAGLKAREAAVAAAEAKIARAAIEARVDAAIAAGRMLPAQKVHAVNFALGLADGEATIDFGEGDKAKKVSQREAYLLDLESRGKIVEYGELARPPASGSGPEPIESTQATLLQQVTSGGAKAA